MKEKGLVAKLGYLLLGFWSFLLLFLIGWVAYSSFKTSVEIFQNPWSMPKRLALENYVHAWSVANMGKYFFNSICIVLISIVLLIFFASMAAYVLSRSRFSFVGRNYLLMFFTAGIGIPFQLILVPLFTQLENLHLVDTHLGLILVYVSLFMPFNILVLTGFFGSIPREIEDSAKIDGCSEYRLFFRIMLPLASPGLITAAMFSFVNIWTEYLLALVFISSSDKQTLSLGMYHLQTTMQYTADWGALFAGVVIMLVPSAIVLIFLQRYIISGLTMGAVKG